MGDWSPGKEKQQKVTFGCLNRLVTFVTVLNGRLPGCLEQYMEYSSKPTGSVIIHTKQMQELFMSELADLIEAPIEIVFVLV